MTTRQTSSAAKDNLSTKTFTCVRCNPTASVWRCDGRPQGREVKWLHQKGDLAVFEGSEPVRLSSGDIRVFQSIGEAETYALDLYARDTESIFWEDGRPVIDTTFFIDIIYDPPTYGDARPFVCWIRDPFDKPIYEEPRPSRYAKAGAKRAGGNVADEAGNKDELAAIAAAKRLKAIASEEGSKVYSERPKTFATPWGAREAAEKHERTIMYGYLPGWMQDHYDRKGRL